MWLEPVLRWKTTTYQPDNKHQRSPRTTKPRSIGSYYVESLTNEITENAWKLIEEVEELGGMTKAIESGI
jgi:hypothetical protein